MALNPKTQWQLSSETVVLVQETARALNYIPQKQASILRSGRSYCIGAVWIDGYYHAPKERVRNLAQAAIEAQYQLVALDVSWFGNNYKGMQEYLLGFAVEGIVFCNLNVNYTKPWIEFLAQHPLPAIALSSGFSELESVHPDLKGMFRTLTEHHLAQGSRHLHLLNPAHHPIDSIAYPGHYSYERGLAFIEAIRAAGGEVIADKDTAHYWGLPTTFSNRRARIRGWIHYPPHTPEHKNAFSSGYLTATKILKKGLKAPTSFICSNDDLAVGAMHAAFEQSIAIPSDLIVSGADNTPYGEQAYVPLTTVDSLAPEMGRWAIRRLIELIENPEQRSRPTHNIFDFELVVRQSTKRTPNNP
jgi:Transcriptional regulators